MSARELRYWFAVLVIAVLLHAAIPRYDFRVGPGSVPWRIDRWTGHVTLPNGRVVPYETPATR